MDPRAHVLLVDDDARNRALLGAMLRDQYRTTEANSGAEALAILERERVDAVLLDVMMPDQTGDEVCKSIKQRHRGAFLPVLLITALSDQEQKNKGLQAGADDFLAKPVDRRELQLRLRALLRLRAQDSLIRTQLDQLAKLQSTKDEMLSLMVHDLRSPLSGAAAYLNLLIEELPEGRWREDAAAALRGTESVLHSLQEALQIRLLEEGQLPIKRAPVDLPRVVADAVATVEAVSRRKRIELSNSFDGNAVASLDGNLVRRALENLLNNALKYTPAGKDVGVAVRHSAEGIEIDVLDRGPGIPDDLKASMFQKFGSVEAKKGGSRKGFGLGLYLVKLVTEGHGGHAVVLDRPGGGALFRLQLRTAVA